MISWIGFILLGAGNLFTSLLAQRMLYLLHKICCIKLDLSFTCINGKETFKFLLLVTIEITSAKFNLNLFTDSQVDHTNWQLTTASPLFADFRKLAVQIAIAFYSCLMSEIFIHVSKQFFKEFLTIFHFSRTWIQK